MIDWQGNVKVEVMSSGIIVDTTQFHNLITEDGLNWMAKCVYSELYSANIKYMGWGSSNLTPSTGQTTLSSETGRKEITSHTVSTSFTATSITYLAPTDAIGQIQELAWFVGTSALSSADTGCMISRTLYSRLKTNLESITVTRVDSFINTTS